MKTILFSLIIIVISGCSAFEELGRDLSYGLNQLFPEPEPKIPLGRILITPEEYCEEHKESPTCKK